MIYLAMLIRVLAILGLLIQPMAIAVGLDAAACDQRDVVAVVSSEMPACGCCEMATSCSSDSPMICGCMDRNEPATPVPASPRNNNSQSIAVPAFLASAIIVDLPDARHPVLSNRTILSYRSHTHKQATLCVWRT